MQLVARGRRDDQIAVGRRYPTRHLDYSAIWRLYEGRDSVFNLVWLAEVDRAHLNAN